MRKVTGIIAINLVFALVTSGCYSQVRVSGTVFDSSKIYVIPDVQVYTTSGAHTTTDSLGIYHINASGNDSIYFFYQGKNSIKYAVNKIYDLESFDISMIVHAKNKYKLLQEVRVFTDTYKFDSLENRQKYSAIFDRDKPTIHTGFNPTSGVAGVDVGSIIELFQFRKNKQRQAFQNRLLQQERDAYVDYRFNSQLISRITGLKGKDLEVYKKIYRPTYEFVLSSSMVSFYTYILNTSYAFKARHGIQDK